MTNYLSDEMIDRVKILILYILKNIEIIDRRKLIQERMFDFENELLNTEWIEQELEIQILMVDIIIQIGINQTKMINYEYLEYWRKDMEQIRLIEILMKKNLLGYIKTRNMEHIVYFKNNIEELIRLKQITKECYDIAFQQT